MLLDVGRGLDLILCHRDLQLVRADLDPAERHEGQVTTDESLLDRGELRHVGLYVHVYVLELADLLAVGVHQQLSVPVGDVELHLIPILIHRFRLPFFWTLLPIPARVEVVWHERIFRGLSFRCRRLPVTLLLEQCSISTWPIFNWVLLGLGRLLAGPGARQASKHAA